VAAVRAVADAVLATSTKLAADWEAPEQVTFNNDVTGLAEKVTLAAGQVLS
jgi:hypothetical protein